MKERHPGVVVQQPPSLEDLLKARPRAGKDGKRSGRGPGIECGVSDVSSGLTALKLDNVSSSRRAMFL